MMKLFNIWRRSALVVAVSAIAVVAATATRALASTTQVTGTLTDGATWRADIPSSWNGTLLLYSHGFGPLLAADAPSTETRDALLARGYALVGSSYDPNGSWWALRSAVHDQFETIGAVVPALSHRPDRVLAVGTSMGGLVSALEAQQGRGRIDGALSTCGIVAGAVDLNNYQLDAEYVISKLLLAPSAQPKLVNFASVAEGAATGAALTAAVQQAQTTPQGRARLALAFAFLNATPAAPGVTTPDLRDADAVEAAQYQSEVVAFSLLNFIEFGRPWIEQSAGGNGSWTVGEDFASLLRRSQYDDVVRTLYREADLDLRGDLETLTEGASIPADPAAIASLEETSVPTGNLEVPELTLHTNHDPLVPVEMENTYEALVRSAGDRGLLRQAYVDHWGHCAFTTAELVAGVEALGLRVETGHWGSLAQPQKLQERATGLGLGPAAFIRFRPQDLSGDNGPFDPRRNALPPR